ncbi:MAG: hypothetical protein KGD73_06860 [Candidatus Lokiarchaeota archaeon]|nr:hypothetical protein [Candidatus Lokiarchaeota archaeon]
MDVKEIVKKCKLTEEEMQNYLQITKDIDHKEDHSRAYRTMMNPTRRELLKFIGTNVRTFDQIQNKFQLDEELIKYHLSMLVQLHYIINSENNWKATPRGIGFLYNAVMGN